MINELIFKDFFAGETPEQAKTGKIPQAYILNKDGEKILKTSGNFTKAEKKFSESIKLDPAYVTPLLNLAKINLALNRNSEAKLQADKAMKISPGNPDVVLVLARIAINKEKYDDARKLLESCLVKTPLSADCLGWRGILARRMKNSGEAEKNLSKSIEIAPDNLLFRIELARACYENGNAEEFYRQCNEALVYAHSTGREEMALYIRMLLREKSEKRI
jgi:Tfp pilus assembly protein PilF